MSREKKIDQKKIYTARTDNSILRLLGILVALILIAGITKSNFFTLSNFQSITAELVVIGLLSLGCGVCMISGGIDLSVVYIANLCGIMSGIYLKSTVVDGMSGGQEGLRIFVAILISLAVGVACGALNGFLVSFLKIPAMLATLGTFELFYGIGIVVSGGSSISNIPGSYSDIGNGMLFNSISISFLIFIGVAVLMHFVMSKTKFGTRVYLVGTNIKAADFAGIKTKQILIRAYMLSGLIASVAGLVSLAKLNSAKADFGTSYTMQAILVSVLGGVNPNGGFGSIVGIVIAVFILQVLSSFLNMFSNISNFFRDLIWGVALIAVMIMNYTITNRKQNKLS